MAEAKKVAFGDGSLREQMTPEEMAQAFTDVASIYDETWKAKNYQHPGYVADKVTDFYEPKRRGDVRILDVAAGTGLLAEELLKRGFRNIDGLDPSEGMKNEAMRKKIYQEYFLEYMDGRHINSIPTGTYDCLAVSGGFNTGLLPCMALVEMVRLVKKGGLICLGIREIRLNGVKEYNNRLGPLMSLLEEKGAWSLFDKTIFDVNDPTIIYSYTVKSHNLDADALSKTLIPIQ